MSQVAQTIANQIGKRAFLMMGAGPLIADGNTLRFRIKGCHKINMIKITPQGSDTYKMEFLKVRGFEVKTVAEWEDAYDDMLHSVIESETGLRLSL